MQENKREIVIERIFNAPRERVWKAWTTAEEIRKWWGPKPFTAPEITIDLSVGGKYLYCMRGAMGPGQPEMDMWSGGTFLEIVPLEKIVVSDHFADKDGTKIDPTAFGFSPDFPKEMNATVRFEDMGGKTKLTITYNPDSDAMYDAMENTGMREGWGSSLDKLAEVAEK